MPSWYGPSLRYRAKFLAMSLYDEQQENTVTNDSTWNNNDTTKKNQTLLEWIKENYGENKTNLMEIETFQNLSEPHRELQSFLEWFRSEFPYYHPRCDYCNAPFTILSRNEEPSKEEFLQRGLINTEVMDCNQCNKTTKFQRHLFAMEIVGLKRGRCQEYSLLLFRMLRALGHSSRVVVGHGHMWNEVWMKQRWVHMDPCEAELDHPLLYQEWGRTMTYVTAFEAPLQRTNQRQGPTSSSRSSSSQGIDVADVTTDYTTSTPESLGRRRWMHLAPSTHVAVSIDRVNKILESLSPSQIVSTWGKKKHERHPITAGFGKLLDSRLGRVTLFATSFCSGWLTAKWENENKKSIPQPAKFLLDWVWLVIGGVLCWKT